jgi:hypothetical protein
MPFPKPTSDGAIRRSNIKAHHVAIVAVCTITVFVLSFELGKRVHRPAPTNPRPYHGFINRPLASQVQSAEWLLVFVSMKGSPGARGSTA